jgi:hypothetical protein
MPPQVSGMPRSSSGIANVADAAATRRSQAEASTSPPPTQCPWIDAIVSWRTAVRASAARRPRSAVSPGSALEPAKSSRSNPAEKARPDPATITTFTSRLPPSQRHVSMISPSITLDRAFNRSGRCSVRRAIAPSTVRVSALRCGGGVMRRCLRAATAPRKTPGADLEGRPARRTGRLDEVAGASRWGRIGADR